MSQASSPEDVARPEHPVPLAEHDLYEAVRAFTLAYALPALDPDRVCQGCLEDTELPPLTDDCALIGVLSVTGRGTPLETFTAPDPDPQVPGELAVRSLMEAAVRIAFYSGDDTARIRAQHLMAMSRSEAGAQFFADRGLSCLYADDTAEHQFRTGPGVYGRMCALTLHVAFWSGCGMDFPYFNTISLARFANVDVHHPHNR